MAPGPALQELGSRVAGPTDAKFAPAGPTTGLSLMWNFSEGVLPLFGGNHFLRTLRILIIENIVIFR
jgi:hypothetical protein